MKTKKAQAEEVLGIIESTYHPTKYRVTAIFKAGINPLTFEEAWEQFCEWLEKNHIDHDFNKTFIINRKVCLRKGPLPSPTKAYLTVGQSEGLNDSMFSSSNQLQVDKQLTQMQQEMNCVMWTNRDLKARISRVIKRKDKNLNALKQQLEIRDGVIKDLLIALNLVTMKHEGKRINEWKYKEKIYKGLIEFTNGRKEFDDSESLSSDTYGSIDSPRD